jgi:hypothetical protein
MGYDRHGTWQDSDNTRTHVTPAHVEGEWLPEKHGQIIYDERYGHVCTCTQKIVSDSHGATYKPTVKVDRSIEPTESGSWWYHCTRCGAGGWSGA